MANSKQPTQAQIKAAEQARLKKLSGTYAEDNKKEEARDKRMQSTLSDGSFSKKFLGVNNVNKSTPLTKINQLKNFEGVDFATSGMGYVFFTPPDMNLVNHPSGRSELYNYIEFLGMTEEGRHILSYLDASAYSGKASNNKFSSRIFINLLTNMAKSFEAKDTSLEVSNRETFVGYRTSTPTDYTDSISTDSFTINYYDVRDLYVLKLHKLWVDYMHNVRKGYYSPKNKYIKTRIIDYMSSMYFILVGEDGSEIKYWAKYTGVYPVNIPYSGASWHGFENATLKEFSVTYNYNFKEDMDVSIIAEFSKYATTAERNSGKVSNTLVAEHAKKTNQLMKEMWAIGVGVALKNGKYYLLFDKDNTDFSRSAVKWETDVAGRAGRYV